ncbi:MAG: M16 family metallopeptidase [Opitutales bacterium]
MPAAKSARADLALLTSFWTDDVSREVLPNGLTLLLKPDRRAALASVQVWVKTGSLHEDAHLGAGLSHYLEHLLFKGTTRRQGKEISTTVQAHGGYINAYTTFDRTVYHIDVPAEHTGLAVDVLADMILHSTLPADEVTRERDVILREIDMVQDEPDQRLAEALFATAFREHPYRHPIIGHRDVFAAVTRDDLLAYYRARYVPNNLVVIVVGDVQPAAVRALVAEHFGTAPRARLAPVLVPDEPRQLAPRQMHRFEPVEISRAGLAWQVPGLAHADSPALDVLAMILGAGESSLLWQQVREKAGLVHSIDATSWNPGSTGLFYISILCDADKRERATAAIGRELARLRRQGCPAARMRQAVRQLVVSEINTRKTMSGQASRLGVAEVVVGDLSFSRSYFEALVRLTPRDLQRVLGQYLVPDTCTSVSLNPAPIAATNNPAPKQAAPARAEFEEITLSNGARLLLQPDPTLPNLHLRLCCLGGSLFEEPTKRGATALLATLLAKDTRRRSAAAVARHIEEVGGTFHSFAGNNSLGLAVEVLPTDADLALEILSDAVLQPSFRLATLRTERDAQLAALREENDDVVSLGRKLLRQRFFGRHPLAIESAGDEGGVKALDREDIVALHRRLLVAGNCVMAVAGSFDSRRLAARCRAFLAQLPRTPLVRQDGAFAGPENPGSTIEKLPRQQAVVLAAYPAPPLRAPDFHAGEVLEEFFSGMSSRLFERVRDELGLAYFVRSARVIGLDTAMFYFSAGTAPGSEEAVRAEIAREIKRVADGGVELAELRRCQTRLKAARRMSVQTNGSRAMQASLNALYGLLVNDLEDYDARIDAVAAADLTAFARRYLVERQCVRLTVRP